MDKQYGYKFTSEQKVVEVLVHNKDEELHHHVSRLSVSFQGVAVSRMGNADLARYLNAGKKLRDEIVSGTHLFRMGNNVMGVVNITILRRSNR